MRQASLGVAVTIVALELVAGGGLKSGQNQTMVAELSQPGVIGAAGQEGSSVGPRNLYALPFPHSSGGTVGEPGAGAGVRNRLDELNRSTNRRSSLLVGLYILQGALQALDAHATLRALHNGSVREGNPIIRPFASQPAALVIFKLGLGAGTIYGIDRLHKSHSRLATTTLSVINAGYVYVVQHNYRCFSAR